MNALIWVIDIGLPGVTNQCVGVARAIAQLGPCRIEPVKLRLRSRLLQPVFRIALRWNLLDGLQSRRSARLLSRLLFSHLPLGGELPDVTISSGGRGEIAAAFLGKAMGAVVLHIGVPRRVPSENFDFVMSLAPQDNSGLRCPSISLDMAPTPVLLADVNARQGALLHAWKRRHAHVWAVMVGGDGTGYSYRPDEWVSLARSLERLGRAFGAGCLITTSRRTGAAAEAILKAEGPAEAAVIDATWYSEAARNVVVDYLAAADVVFCTEDSRSMISDAIAAGKPVYVIRPETSASAPRITEFLVIQETKRRIKRIRIADLAGIDVDQDIATYFQPLTECWSVKLLAALDAELPALRSRFIQQRSGG
jgi:uncharacterized protein